MEIRQWVNRVHGLAKEKGWWKLFENGTVMLSRPPLELHMLMVTEIAEASEAFRDSLPPVCFIKDGVIYDYQNLINSADPEINLDKFVGKEKPEGEAIELADVVIRIMDYFGAMGWNLEDCIALKHEYNSGRPYRHGGKKA